jgi:hypothetical protein
MQSICGSFLIVGKRGPNWRGEFNLWQDEQISEWTLWFIKEVTLLRLKMVLLFRKDANQFFSGFIILRIIIWITWENLSSLSLLHQLQRAMEMDHVRQVDHDRQLGSDRQRALHRVHQHVHRSNSNFKASSATGKEQFPGKSVIGTDHSSDSIFYTSNQGAVKECDLLSVGKKISSEIQGALFVTIVWCRGTWGDRVPARLGVFPVTITVTFLGPALLSAEPDFTVQKQILFLFGVRSL